MFNEPNLELVVLCVTLLIETSIRPDLTEMLRISNCIYRDKNGMALPAAQPRQKCPVVLGLSTL